MINKLLNKMNMHISRIFPRASIKFMKEEFGNKELIGAEIGTYKGENAESILQTLNIKKLYLIDPYELYEGYDNKVHNYGDGNDTLDKAEIEAELRLEVYNIQPMFNTPNFEPKIVWIKKLSKDAVKDIPDNLDFVYIDGDHQYSSVVEDMKLYYPKLRKGGILAGHDIENGRVCKAHTGVILAFMELILTTKDKPYIMSPDFWVVKGESYDKSKGETKQTRRKK